MADHRARERNEQMQCEMTRLLRRAATNSAAKATQQAAVAFKRQQEESSLAHKHHQLFTAPPPVREPTPRLENKQRSKSVGDLSPERSCGVSAGPQSVDPVTSQRSEGQKGNTASQLEVQATAYGLCPGLIPDTPSRVGSLPNVFAADGSLHTPGLPSEGIRNGVPAPAMVPIFQNVGLLRKCVMPCIPKCIVNQINRVWHKNDLY